MKKFFKYIMVFMLMFSTSCEAWLDIDPEEERASTDYWITKNDVKNTTMAGYVSLRECLQKIVQWGELRGNVLDCVSKDEDEQDIKTLDITSTNDIVRWDEFYKVINTVNSVLANAALVLERDETFKEDEYKSFMSENIFIRSLCYFYLVRSFGEVPFMLEPFLTDKQGTMHKKSSEQIIINGLIKDLEAALDGASLEFSTIPVDDWENSGRATRWAILALLADIYLWDGQYEKVVTTCDLLITSGRFYLLEQEDWFLNYSPGKTPEIIFQICFDHSLNQSNNMYTWFQGNNKTYSLTERFVQEFEDEDKRGLGGTFDEDKVIWKYIGQEHQDDGSGKRASTDRSPNWICYRYADVLLMKAEALVMSGETNYESAIAYVNEIRGRAGADSLTMVEVEELVSEGNMSIEASFLNKILDERKKEFVAEGKDWYDMLRIGKRDGYKYKDMMIDIVIENVDILNRPIYETKLSDTNAYFFPIHFDEIENGGGALIQNPYYLK